MDSNKIIFHIDVNSAYLSWTAAYKLQRGECDIDIRTIPSVIGGDDNSRHGIVLAKSIPAKKFNIKTGETLYSARGKCPNLKVYPSNYSLYMKCSDAMFNLLQEYSPIIQRYSVDECFVEFINLKDDYYKLAEQIKNRIENELGFTVNIGISNNKLLAKMASDFEKPNKIHTLFPDEISKKMWPLPIEDLFMVGRATAPKLKKLNIYTIGDLANYDLKVLIDKFKSQGKLIYDYANGFDNSSVREKNYVSMKGIGNGITIAYDIDEKEDAYKVLLSLSESVGMRLRASKNLATVVSITIRNKEFLTYSRQKKVKIPTDSTTIIFDEIKLLFNKMWMGEEIRQLSIRVSGFSNNDFYQESLFEEVDIDKNRKIDNAMDSIRERFGEYSVIRSTFLNSGINPISGGNGEVDYPYMGSIL